MRITSGGRRSVATASDDLPVPQPTKLEFGHQPTLLARADEVIE
jgi:hypothetical protein